MAEGMFESIFGGEEETASPLIGAEAFAAATEKAPHYADPLKAWGDLLAGREKWAEAQAKYDEALKYAPAWQPLKLARDEAARHQAG